jgi:transcriptional regulator with XRE-family HTH domain
MESLGKFLKAEGEARNRSLEEVTSFTRVNIKALQWIEEDRYELLPSRVYVKGYLRNYARYLGLDPAEVIQKFEASLPDSLSDQDPRAPQRRPWKKRNGSLSRQTVLVVLAMIGACAGLWLSGAFSHKIFIAALFPPPHPFILPGELRRPTDPEVEPTQRQKVEDETLDFSSLRVIETGIGTDIVMEDGRVTLKERSNRTEANNKRVYFLTRLETQREGKVTHVWFWQNREYHRQDIEVKPPGWSVYSYLTLRPDHVGSWRAEVREGEQILASQNLDVTTPLANDHPFDDTIDSTVRN